MPAASAPIDRYLAVSVTPDRLRAVLVLAARRSPKGRAEPLPPVAEITERIAAMAQARGVTAALDRAGIEKAVILWRSRAEQRELTIARGRAPVAGADAELTLHPPRAGEPTGAFAWDRVGKRNQGRVVNVERNTTLATLRLPTAGTPGRAVTGEQLAAEPGRAVAIETSPFVGAVEARGVITYRASQSGILVELSARRIEVASSIEIRGDVDHATGNLDVWGSVTLRGSVQDGFSVRARGDLTIDGAAASAYLESGGHVTIGGGILGKAETTRVKCRGDCTARFVENATVEAGGSVRVRDFVLQSRILAGGGIDVAGRGAVIASRLAAGGSVSASTFGSDARLPVEIVVGANPMEWRKLVRLEREVRFLRRVGMQSAAPCRGRDADRRVARRRAAVVGEAMLARRRKAILEALMGEGGPSVQVRRQMFPRTTVRLGPYELRVEAPLGPGVLRIDAEKGAIVLAPDRAGAAKQERA